MKRKFLTFTTFILLAIMSVVCLVACDKQGKAKAEIVSKTDTVVVIKIVEEEPWSTLISAMEYLKEEGELTFEMTDKMITSIENKANAADFSRCWMLYTSDAEMSNTEWGTYEYDGKTLGSAILGAESLEVVASEIYVWVYTTF